MLGLPVGLRSAVSRFQGLLGSSTGDTCTDEDARRILGEDFVSPKEAFRAWRIAFNPEDFRRMPLWPDIDWLKANRYVLVPGPPVTKGFPEVCSLRRSLFTKQARAWGIKRGFTGDNCVGPGWIAIRKQAVCDSVGKMWLDQKNLVFGVEAIPNVVELAWVATTVFRVTGERLFEKASVRTSSVPADFPAGVVLDGDCHNILGPFTRDGLEVGCILDDKTDCLGIAACRRF